MADTVLSLAARVERLEKDTAELFFKVNDTRETQAGINEKLSAMLTTLGEVKEAVTNLQQRPAKKLDLIFQVVLAAALSGIVGYLIAQIR
jgi:hypothetical protein